MDTRGQKHKDNVYWNAVVQQLSTSSADKKQDPDYYLYQEYLAQCAAAPLLPLPVSMRNSRAEWMEGGWFKTKKIRVVT